MNTLGWLPVLLPAMALAGLTDNSGTDPGNKHAWGENVGWANAAPANHEVSVHFNGDAGWLSGYVWGENIGWINMGNTGGGPYANTSADNWGVNVANNGGLSGYAWGENVGWINFGSVNGNAAIDLSTGHFSGHAWGENIGWLALSGTSPDYGVRTRAFDSQSQGTPNWWLDFHGVTESHNAGDGIPAWQKYVMDTDPNIAGDYLRITSMSTSKTGVTVVFSPASPRRYYTVKRCKDLTLGEWSSVAEEDPVHYATGGEKSVHDTNTAEQVFYSVDVQITP